MNVGMKRVCLFIDRGVERKVCVMRGMVSNYFFFRMDLMVIMVIVSVDGLKVFLGR